MFSRSAVCPARGLALALVAFCACRGDATPQPSEPVQAAPSAVSEPAQQAPAIPNAAALNTCRQTLEPADRGELTMAVKLAETGEHVCALSSTEQHRVIYVGGMHGSAVVAFEAAATTLLSDGRTQRRTPFAIRRLLIGPKRPALEVRATVIVERAGNQLEATTYVMFGSVEAKILHATTFDAERVGDGDYKPLGSIEIDDSTTHRGFFHFVRQDAKGIKKLRWDGSGFGRVSP